jgi:polar amino acid transport system permease protein
LSARAARFPWWALIIAVGLVVLFYSFATSTLYRRVLLFVTDNPQVTTNRFARVGYSVQSVDGNPRTVRGTLIAQDAETVTLETEREVRTPILRADISILTCSGQANADGSCPLGEPVTLERVTTSGALIFEDLGKYRIVISTGETVDIRKTATAAEVRTPDKCRADPEGACMVTLQLKPNTEGNIFRNVRLLEEAVDSITVEEVPGTFEVIQRKDILQELDYRAEQCALNNLAGCDEGPFLTLIVTFGAFVLSCVLGLTFGLMRISANPILTNIATLYVEVVRGVPLLVILLFVNFAFAPWFRDEFPNLATNVIGFIWSVAGVVAAYLFLRGLSQRLPLDEAAQPAILVALLAAALSAVVSYFAANSDLSVLQRAILGLAFGYGAFLAELFRAGIQSIGKGQMEAARSLGMGYVQAMRYVILPQAFRVVVPPLGNEFIAILKDTSLIAVIAVPELTQRARLFASDTFQVFPSYITIAALYLLMTLFLSFLVRTVERRMNAGR